jgi:uncharacterized alpha-E superfamily protein
LSLERLPRADSALRVAGRLKRNLESAEPRRLNQQQLHDFIDELQTAIGELHREISHTWFLPPRIQETAA